MKLRVKQGSATLKLVVDDDCSYEDFKAAVARALGCQAAEVKGSLNKKVVPPLHHVSAILERVRLGRNPHPDGQFPAERNHKHDYERGGSEER